MVFIRRVIFVFFFKKRITFKVLYNFFNFFSIRYIVNAFNMSPLSRIIIK